MTYEMAGLRIACQGVTVKSHARRIAQTWFGLSVISVLLPGVLSSCSYCGVFSEGPQVNFDNPIPGGFPVADVAAAKARVTFHPLVPPDLGRNIGPVRKILASDNTIPANTRMIALLYDTKSYGRVVVEEIRAFTTAAQFNRDEEQSLADINSHSHCGSAKVVTIRRGLEGFLAGGALLYWREPTGVEMIVRGPKLTERGSL